MAFTLTQTENRVKLLVESSIEYNADMIKSATNDDVRMRFNCEAVNCSTLCTCLISFHCCLFTYTWYNIRHIASYIQKYT